MKIQSRNLPFYFKLTTFLLGSVCFIGLFYIASGIITPILLSLLFSIVLLPFSNFLSAKLKFSNALASFFTVLLFILIILGLLFFISWQISRITNDWLFIKNNLLSHLKVLQNLIYNQFNLTISEQNSFFNDYTNNLIQTGEEIATTLVKSVTDAFLNLTLIPIYTFLFLFYRTLFIDFLSRIYPEKSHELVKKIIGEIKLTLNNYIIGLFIEMIAVATLTSIGLLLIGVKYAIVLGIITGLLNLIPYIGILFAGFLSIIVTLSTSSEISQIISVLFVVIIVQIIDNNLLITFVLSSKVKINAFVSIIGILIGGALSGIPGMILAIPICVILKVIFDNVPTLQPWGYLMADDIPKESVWKSTAPPITQEEPEENN